MRAGRKIPIPAMLAVAETYVSVNGEGNFAGEPTLFIRLAGCNLRCDFCDSKYTWDTSTAKLYSTNQLYDEILYYFEKYPNLRNILYTGGEPLTQLEGLWKITKKVAFEVGRLKNITQILETNATIKFQHPFTSYFDFYVLSPKIPFPQDFLKIWHSFPHTYTIFKFVVDAEPELKYIIDAIREANIKAERVWLMPQGKTDDEVKERAGWIIEKCKEYGFNFSPRLQIWLWGNKRGV